MKFKLLASSLLMSGVFALSGAVSVANANLLTIVADSAFAPVLKPTDPNTPPYGGNAEAIGDPGGTSYPTAPTTGASPGSGLPTALGPWPSSPNFAQDPSFGNKLGISGYDGSYLKLENSGNVTFQFLGKGDSSLQNLFQIFDAAANAWVTKWDSKSATNGTTGVSGLSTPIYTDAPGSSFTQFFKAGLIGFRFETIGANGLIADVSNDGSSNIHDNPIGPHFFLGVDPYLATGKFDNSGSAVFAGLTDQGFVAAGDHDYEDLVVRISVPEPGILALLMAGLLGFGVLRRRQAASDAVGLLA